MDKTEFELAVKMIKDAVKYGIRTVKLEEGTVTLRKAVGIELRLGKKRILIMSSLDIRHNLDKTREALRIIEDVYYHL